MTEPFLRIPPFPGSRAQPLVVPGGTSVDKATAAELSRLLSKERVGGVFWGSQPRLPKDRDLVLAPGSREQALDMIEAARAAGVLDCCAMITVDGLAVPNAGIPELRGTIDWWHLADTTSDIWVDADHELALVAGLTGRAARPFGDGRFARISENDGVIDAVREVMGGLTFVCPFSGDPITPVQAIELLSDWKRLIDRNRKLSAIVGVAGWKRPTVDPMLWDGANGPSYTSAIPNGQAEETYLGACKSRTPNELLDRAMRAHLPIAEIEDGLIRGRGLGANCVPPLSIVVDFSGIYFDPSQPSDLEQILQLAEIEGELLERAARLRARIVEAGISKYGGGTAPSATSDGKRRVLVVGQVEDDRSVLNGGAGQTNLELLERARAIEPDAWLIYRPHPDVEAGHRKGHVPDQRLLTIADEIERGGSISALIESVDEVHCITSLAGFEALLRGKKVTTHGVPFYAGWGLTTDLGPIPPRRSRRRSLDELVAAAIILYPTYVDPVTRLPCPPEILVERIALGQDSVAAPLASLRALQGRLKLAFRRLREVAA
jgi:capsular polysaccharide export protein